MNYYDPMFYIVSEEMPFTIRIEVKLRQEKIDADALAYAANRAIQRYPYFAIQVERQTTAGAPAEKQIGAPAEKQIGAPAEKQIGAPAEKQIGAPAEKQIGGPAEKQIGAPTERQTTANEEWIAVPNPRPIVVYPGPETFPLGSKEVNYHMLALSYENNEIFFHTSHVITDGCGYFPYVKTVLYYYLCRSEHKELDPEGIRLIEEPFYDDELGNPFPEEKMVDIEPLGKDKDADYFRLTEGGYVTDKKDTVYRFRMNAKEVMSFSFDHDGSPCALISALMTKAVWSLHPQEEKDIVSAISFNLRPGLGNGHSYRMLCNALRLYYPSKIRDWEILKVCTVTRSMISLKSHPNNVLSYAKKLRLNMERFLNIPTIEEKKKILGARALDDSISNTFSVSYVGQMGLGSLEPYIESVYNITDGSTHQTLFIEVSAVNDDFNIAMIQGFSSDVYYRAFLDQLRQYGINYIEEEPTEMRVSGVILP